MPVHNCNLWYQIEDYANNRMEFKFILFFFLKNKFSKTIKYKKKKKKKKKKTYAITKIVCEIHHLVVVLTLDFMYVNLRLDPNQRSKQLELFCLQNWKIIGSLHYRMMEFSFGLMEFSFGPTFLRNVLY
jgi:hypothetical protein